MRNLSQIWSTIQVCLFPFLEKEFEEPLTEKLRKLAAILELIRIEEFIHTPKHWHGQPPKNRVQIARSFVAKAVYNMTTTRALIDRLKTTPALRRVCGWEKASQIPHESSFSRAFAEFAKGGLAEIVHASLIEQNMSDRLVGHISRDSTSIEAREKAAKKEIMKNAVSQEKMRIYAEQRKKRNYDKNILKKTSLNA